MSEYIFRPPPPPPASSSSAPEPSRNSYSGNGLRGGTRGGRLDRNSRAGEGGGRGGRRNGHSGGSRGGRAFQSYQVFASSGVTQPQQFYAQQQQIPSQPPYLLRQPQRPLSFHLPLQSLQPTPIVSPGTLGFPDISPFAQCQLQTPAVATGHSPSVQLGSTYLSYSQEQYQAQNPLAPLPQLTQKTPAPLPQADSYTDASSGWPTQSSYGYYEAPSLPTAAPMSRQRKDQKPDMDEAMWLSLNGGKLIGTNIAPPETPEEIEAWIKERKARFPTAKKIAEDAEKKGEIKARDRAWETQALKSNQPLPGDLQSFNKRKHSTTDAGPLAGSDINDIGDPVSSPDYSDSGAPETVSSKTKSTLPDVQTTKHAHEPRPTKLPPICRTFTLRGSCSRGQRCYFRHEQGPAPKKRKDKKVDDDEKKTLYQRLMEHDREKENALMLQVIKYLTDKGELHTDGGLYHV